jgi:hypothetical protein
VPDVEQQIHDGGKTWGTRWSLGERGHKCLNVWDGPGHTDFTH